MTSLVDIEGIAEEHTTQLRAANVGTVGSLLSQGATPAGRKKIAAASGIGEARILWPEAV